MTLCLGFHMQIRRCTLQSRIQHHQYHQTSFYHTTTRHKEKNFRANAKTVPIARGWRTLRATPIATTPATGETG